MVHVRPATPADAAVWLTYRCDLFYGSEDEHRAEIERFFAGRAKEPLAALGFADVGTIRCFRKPVAIR